MNLPLDFKRFIRLTIGSPLPIIRLSAWSSAIHLTQKAHITFRKHVATIRRKSKDGIYNELIELESWEFWDKIVTLHHQLRIEEDITLLHTSLFFRQWWAGRVDKPSKEMFKNLRRKHQRETIPLLSSENGKLASQEDNLWIAKDHTSLVAKAHIRVVRKKVIPPLISAQLESNLTCEEIKRATVSLKQNKTLGIDGLPIEFFQMFKEVLAPIPLLIWEESVKHKALPVKINTGIIKLLHKKGPKEILTNWRPLKMLNSAYKIFAKAIVLRITLALAEWLCAKQKGFEKGRRIMEAVISMWEGIEHVKSSKQDHVFVKVDFDKADDRLEWSFIMESMDMMGFGPKIIDFDATPKCSSKSRQEQFLIKIIPTQKID
ncbi:hypothetical protein L7F22_050857 [Adiantum nelumboides]|nr:hypothetical protein [Adiantum nelumboides]